MDKKTLLILSMMAIIGVTGLLAWGRYNGLQEEMRGLRDQRKVADDQARRSGEALEDAQRQHQEREEGWEERLLAARQDVSRLQDELSHSQGRERLLEGQGRVLRKDLEDSLAQVLELADDKLVVQIPQSVVLAYPDHPQVELNGLPVAEGEPGRFWTGRTGLQSWEMALGETLNLRIQVDTHIGISEERRIQAINLTGQRDATEEQVRVWQERMESTERILLTALDAKSGVEGQLRVADRQIGTLEDMVYFKWWPDLGVGMTCGVTMRRGDPDCVIGASLNWRLKFR